MEDERFKMKGKLFLLMLGLVMTVVLIGIGWQTDRRLPAGLAAAQQLAPPTRLARPRLVGWAVQVAM